MRNTVLTISVMQEINHIIDRIENIHPRYREHETPNKPMYTVFCRIGSLSLPLQRNSASNADLCHEYNHIPHAMSIIKEFFRENFFRTNHEAKPGRQRIEFIDLAKGICILFVLLYHVGYTWYTPLVQAIRIPLYFILSGLFFKDYGDFAHLLVKKVNRLIIPFLFFFVLGILAALCTDRSASVSRILQEPFIGPFINNGAIWFLLCLFWVNLFYYFIHTKVRNTAGRLAVCIGIGLTGLLMYRLEIYLPLFLSSALSSTPFFFVGVQLRRIPILYRTEHDKVILIVAVTILIALFTYCQMRYTPNIGFKDNIYIGNYFEIIIISVLGVISFLILCKVVKWLPIISYMGRYSIIILGLHCIFIDYGYLPFHLLTGHNFTMAEILVLTLLLSWLAIPVFKRYFGKFCAQKDLI